MYSDDKQPLGCVHIQQLVHTFANGDRCISPSPIALTQCVWEGGGAQGEEVIFTCLDVLVAHNVCIFLAHSLHVICIYLLCCY